MWWRKENSNTTDGGHLYRAAPNVFMTRTPPAVDALQPVVLFPSPEDSEWRGGEGEGAGEG